MINKISLKYSKEEELNHTRVLLKFPFLNTNTRSKLSEKRSEMRFIRRIHKNAYIDKYIQQISACATSNQFPRILVSLVAHPSSPHSVEKLLLLKKELLIRVSIGLAEISRDSPRGWIRSAAA